MFRTLQTLVLGAQARAEERLIDRHAPLLLEQKLREAEADHARAKGALVSLVQRQRHEARLAEACEARIRDLEVRVRAAIGVDDLLAREGAEAIAALEAERAARSQSAAERDRRVLRLRTSVDKGARRLADLRHAAAAAKAAATEMSAQTRVDSTALEEAEALAARILGQPDPFEAAEIRAEIDRADIGDRLSDAGFGPRATPSAQDILDRLSK